MQSHNGYWISGSAVPGPPYTTYWEILGTILKPHRGGSIVEVARLRLPTFTVEIKELAEWFGVELARIAVDDNMSMIKLHRQARQRLSES